MKIVKKLIAKKAFFSSSPLIEAIIRLQELLLIKIDSYQQFLCNFSGVSEKYLILEGEVTDELTNLILFSA